MAATVIVQVPSVIHLPPMFDITYDMLLKQRNIITPSDSNSGFRECPEAAVSDRAAAENVARVLDAHYGSVARVNFSTYAETACSCVPEDIEFDDLLGGSVTQYDGQRIMSPEAIIFQHEVLPCIRSSLFTEKYGPGSFFQRFLLARTFRLSCKVLLSTKSSSKSNLMADTN